MSGVIISNTTISRPPLKSIEGKQIGGLSGKPLFELSTQQLSLFHQMTGGAIPLIGAGGVSDAETAWAKIVAGASLVQLYSALVYKGPALVSDICAGLGQKLMQHNFLRLQDAIGSQNTKSGKYNGAAGAYKTDAPDFIFPENELSRGDSRFFVAKGDPWKFNGTASLEGKKLGAISGYTYSDVINEYIKKNQGSGKVSLVSGDKTPTQRLVSMLLSNPQRVNVVVEDLSVIAYALKQLGSPVDSLQEAGDDGKPDEGIFIAFSPKNPKSNVYAKILSDGMAELRKSGKLKILLEKYGLKDWR